MVESRAMDPPTIEPPDDGAGPNDAAMTALLIAALAPGDSVRVAYHKDRTLAAIFGHLARAEREALERRLHHARDGDALANLFHRLAPARRARLLEVLATLRRRDLR